MVKWSDEQKMAFTKRGSNILLSAAAGSGKTSVLTQRVVNLMEQEQMDIDRLLIFTFTRAAAANMKEKILDKVVNRLEDPEHGEFYHEQLTRINQASILTIHSFCNALIRENFYVLGIDPNFTVYEESQADNIKSEILTRLFEKRYQMRDASFLRLIETYADKRSDNRLAELVLTLYSYSVNHVDFDGWKADMFEGFKDEAYWLELLKGHVCKVIDRAIEISESLLELASREGAGEKVETFLEREHESLKVARSNAQDDVRSLKIVFETLRWPKDSDADLKDRINAMRKQYRDAVNAIRKQYYGEVTIDHQLDMFRKQLPILDDLLELLADFRETFLDYKKRRNVLEYSDLEHFALEVLDNEDVAQRYRERFEYVFVDEYQDSSYIQEAIIQKIIREDNLFMVGDLKQSIYRFRSAVPEIFAEKYLEFSRDEDAIDFKLDLNKNFRSRKGILDFINYVFTDLMTQSFGGIEYDDAARLHHGNHGYQGEDPPVEIHLIKTGHSDLTKEELEVHEIANRIEILNQEEDVPYKDMVVIMRSPSTHVETFTQVFKLRGIPFISNKSYEFMETLEVQQLLNVLRILDNPRQDIPLASVMRSPVFGFDDGDLLAIRQWNPRGSFHANVLEYDIEDALMGKIEKMRSAIGRLRLLSRHQGLGDLIWRIYTDEGFDGFLESLPEGDRRRANVLHLIQIAAEFERFNHATMSRFLEYFDSLERRGQMEGSALAAEDADAVRLMTTHGSKGLEFPVVILAGMNKAFNVSDVSGDVVYHRRMGLFSKYIDPERRVKMATFHRDLVHEVMKREMREEEMRLLYTAMTRAEERLLLFATIRDNQFDQRMDRWQDNGGIDDSEETNQYIDWIMQSLYADKEIQKPQTRLEVIETAERAYPVLNPGAAGWTRETLAQALPEAQETLPEPTSLVAWRKGPAKVSVTDIAHRSINLMDKLDPKHFSAQKPSGDLTAAQLGTQIHKVFQLLRLDKVESFEDFSAQIAFLKDHRMIHPDLSDMFDLSLIYDFFQSPLGQRMIKSTVVYRERPFVLKIDTEAIPDMEGTGQVLVQGIIDCYFVEDGKAVLIDFKSDQVVEEALAQAFQKYEVQLSYYAEAIKKLTGLEVSEQYIHLIRANESRRIV